MFKRKPRMLYKVQLPPEMARRLAIMDDTIQTPEHFWRVIAVYDDGKYVLDTQLTMPSLQYRSLKKDSEYLKILAIYNLTKNMHSALIHFITDDPQHDNECIETN